jgi:hypothetical protein
LVLCFLWIMNWIYKYYYESSEGSQSRQNSKIWSWVPWDSEQRISVLVRDISNLAVSHASECWSCFDGHFVLPFVTVTKTSVTKYSTQVKFLQNLLSFYIRNTIRVASYSNVWPGAWTSSYSLLCSWWWLGLIWRVVFNSLRFLYLPCHSFISIYCSVSTKTA